MGEADRDHARTLDEDTGSVEKTRVSKLLPDMLGLSKHPAILEAEYGCRVLKDSVSRDNLRMVTACVMYGNDDRSKYASMDKGETDPNTSRQEAS